MSKIDNLLAHESFMNHSLAPAALLVVPMVAGAAFVAGIIATGFASLVLFIIATLITWGATNLAFDSIAVWRLERTIGALADQFGEQQVNYYMDMLAKVAQQHKAMLNQAKTADDIQRVLNSARALNIDFDETTQTFTPTGFQKTEAEFVEEKIRALVK